MVIRPEMTVLDIVCQYRQTEAVFRQYEKDAGACLLCEALFDPLAEVAGKYGLDLKKLVADLERAAGGAGAAL